MLVLSIFPGIDLLGMAFEEVGFCVVRGPDLLWGGDVRRFHPPAGRFDGVIGGSPCQDFSSARRDPATGNGLEMVGEFVRVVAEAAPDWWLLENVPGVPDVEVSGYSWQRLDVRASDYGSPQRRLRHVQFGSRSGAVLVLPERNSSIEETAPAVMASDSVTPWEVFAARQGLPAGYDLPFTVTAKRRAVGNGVPLPLGRALADAVVNMVPADTVTLCGCGCGRVVTPPARFGGSACRMRMLRRRRNGSS